jgi:signal transduction histidine kinase
MVLDILYYAKDREPDWTTLSSAAIMNEVFEQVREKGRALGVEVATEVDPQTGAFEADEKAMRALLVNLAENSIDACRLDKKKPTHRVTLRVAGSDSHVQFDVEDNGIGMDQETRDKAFSLFFSSKGSEGTGLGLFIANKIASAHGGTIQIESKVDEGTRFIVVIPRVRTGGHHTPDDSSATEDRTHD